MRHAVVCDFGGVLTTPLVEGFAAYQRDSGIGLEELGRAMTAATERRGGEHPLFALERGEITEPEFRRRLEAELGDGVRLDGLSESFIGALQPNRRMIDFMAQLRERGLRLALCTNNVREWEPLWRPKLPEIDRVFEVVVDSAFVGSRKPETEIFRITVERLGVSYDDCVLVDDLEVNCDAAERLGMAAVRFVDTEQAIAGVEAALQPGTRSDG